MKKYLLIVLVMFTYLALTSCASNRNPYPKSDFVEESWMSDVETNSNRWLSGADSWFLTGYPNLIEQANRNASHSFAVSTTMVNVGHFNKIKVAGDFQVQIFGCAGQNSVFVYGPNDGTRQVSVSVSGDTLWVRQVGPSPTIKFVIVRIGVNQLVNLMHLGGCGTIQGVRLSGPVLDITAEPGATGNMYLGGNLHVRQIINAGAGRINVFGVRSNGLAIKTYNRGSVNVAGNMNLALISHNGNNDINIIGANSSCPFRIYANGAGKIGIKGRVNIREIRANGTTAVFAYPVMSQNIDVFTKDFARVGLAGSAANLYVDTSNASRFWGRRFCVHNAYVRTHDRSHVNISATNKFFASASQNSSVYFFGSPDLMSQFVSGNGVVIPIWRTENNCFIPHHASAPAISDYKGEVLRDPPPVHQRKARSYPVRQPAALDPPSPRSSKPNPYVWKNKKLTENKSYLNR